MKANTYVEVGGKPDEPILRSSAVISRQNTAVTNAVSVKRNLSSGSNRIEETEEEEVEETGSIEESKQSESSGSESDEEYSESDDEYETKTFTVAKTLYACQAEHGNELSFQPGQLIFNVHQSKEPGWLTGSLDGRTGLIPENYVSFIG